MIDINQFFKQYEAYNSTFKETSFDDEKNIYLCIVKDIKTDDVNGFTKLLNKKLSSSLGC